MLRPFVAAIGALSLGAGLALQGLLANYSAGLSIIVARPFVVGDTIMVQGGQRCSERNKTRIHHIN